MEFQIKDEPIDFDDNTSHVGQYVIDDKVSYIDMQYNSERFYLENINNLFNQTDESYLIDSMDISFDTNNDLNELMQKRNNFLITDAINMIQLNDTLNTKQPTTTTKPQNKSDLKITKSKQKNEQIAIEKKRILLSLIESSKEKKLDRLLDSNFCYEPFNQNEETKLLTKLKSILDKTSDSLSPTKLYTYKRFTTKLELRKLKRSKHLQPFDIDSYVNELIDNEKLSNLKSEQTNKNNNSINDDIIFESETLKMDSNNDCFIIATKHVLDRFKTSAHKRSNCYDLSIGIVESRNDDVKCLLSPFTNEILKPYIRRDNITLPIKLALNFQITKQNIETTRHPIDYVHLRPEHVEPINYLCEKFFWNGIDITDCLNYPDYTLVALYKKLVIGFAFLVPNLEHKESYLSFIFVHPDWRIHSNKEQENNKNVSIAQYMLYYLIQKNPDFDITLHVATNSPAVIFYQKFGFEIEEFIKNFYDKYYSDSHNLNKDAFLMRLSSQ